MQKKFLICQLIFLCIFTLCSAEENFDFKLRIFDTKGGERTSGTITVRIEDLKKKEAKLGQTFRHHLEGGVTVLTGIEIAWLTEESGVDMFTGTIEQSDGKVFQEGIKIEFPYDGKERTIYSNKFHTIKVIPNGGHNKSE